MIRPLTYRHPVCGGFTQDESDRVEHFIESFGRNEHDPKSKWIHSLWLFWKFRIVAGDTANSRRVLALTCTSLVPRLVNLRELVCCVHLSSAHFGAIVDSHAPTLRKLAVRFTDESMPSIAPLFNGFMALEDLQIEITEQVSRSWPRQELALPELRLLEIIGTGQTLNSALNWLIDSSMPKLRTASLKSLDDCLLDHDTLSSFFIKHGGNLSRIRYDDSGSSISSFASTVFPNTPRLRYLELGCGFELLHRIPASLIEISFAMSGNQLEYYAPYLHNILSVQRKRPRGSKLSTFRAVIKDMYREDTIFSFEKCLAGRHMTGLMEKKLIERAERLKKLGIRLIDEEGLELLDVVASMAWEE
jgi:hypothetical protein